PSTLRRYSATYVGFKALPNALDPCRPSIVTQARQLYFERITFVHADLRRKLGRNGPVRNAVPVRCGAWQLRASTRKAAPRPPADGAPRVAESRRCDRPLAWSAIERRPGPTALWFPGWRLPKRLNPGRPNP